VKAEKTYKSLTFPKNTQTTREAQNQVSIAQLRALILHNKETGKKPNQQSLLDKIQSRSSAGSLTLPL